MEREKSLGQKNLRRFLQVSFFLVLFSFGRGAQANVTFSKTDEGEDLAVISYSLPTGGNTITLNVGDQGGGSVDDAKDIFIPLMNTASAPTTGKNAADNTVSFFNYDFFIMGESAPQNFMPRVKNVSGTFRGHTATSSEVQVSLDLNNTETTNQTLYAAVYDPNGSGDIYIINAAGETIGTGETNDFTTRFNLANVCHAATYTSDSDFCDGFHVDATAATAPKVAFDTSDIKLYFFMTADKTYTQFEKASTSDHENGLYLNLKLSNKIQTNTNIIKLDSIKNGDQEFTVKYSGYTISELNKVIPIVFLPGSQILETNPLTIQLRNFPYSVMVGATLQGKISLESDPEEGGSDGVSEQGDFKIKTYTTTNSNDITTRDNNKKSLINGNRYGVAVAYVDKWNFSTFFSVYRPVDPQDVNVFLESQMCFLLSAGFKTNHYVLDFFREVRDDFLMNFEAGRAFVEWYYQTAPKYAKIIWESETLSVVVRSLGFVGYYALKYYIFTGLLLLSFGLLILFVILNRRTRSTHEVLFGVK